jgi:hypothetical protein
MAGMTFLFHVGLIVAGLTALALICRVLYAVTPRLVYAPALDVVVSLFIWVPWAAGAWLGGWWGVGAALLAQFIFLQLFCLVDRLVRGRGGRTLQDVHVKNLGRWRNEVALWLTTPAVVVFIMVRAAEIIFYPPMARLAKMPSYRSSEWINLSRHKYQGLVGHDLVWCWYCDWMTGVWALGSEMLRNVESFWCPIRFRDEAKNRHVATDFPDVEKWVAADGTLDDAVQALEKWYDQAGANSWWGHPDRREP